MAVHAVDLSHFYYGYAPVEALENYVDMYRQPPRLGKIFQYHVKLPLNVFLGLTINSLKFCVDILFPNQDFSLPDNLKVLGLRIVKMVLYPFYLLAALFALIAAPVTIWWRTAHSVVIFPVIRIASLMVYLQEPIIGVLRANLYLPPAAPTLPDPDILRAIRYE
ncbi:MAG: hypothetical protein A3F09_02965 [Chlamydiae bacterium RIFCSPHIGHO2_12_FULL_49_11]|nr:MAG: hypothetical protein A3F09_02965 [Chlamydiae bacterium RIFCSPHIGHO2_12_FULL_49_11]